jgi:hypothetical protein
MKDNGKYHSVSCPAVHVPQKESKGNGKLQIFHVLVGVLNGGTIVEHEKNACNCLNDKEKHGYSSQAEGVFYFQSVGSYL